ncbi:hypothetical protein pkur_cds_380 [Pandoravirus kuranda]|uniref:Uncharacterized protein n=1 Tax=Pandoravirus kuranda TaxID=3019033 RepID=A0AA95ED19_9VIRU|nr:hypothetical protein pkur_cds_380 [Pandoravirus kuranda]
MEAGTAPKATTRPNGAIDLCDDQDDGAGAIDAAATRAPNRSPPPGGSGWIRRRSKPGRAGSTDAIDNQEATDTRSPQSRTPPPSGTVAHRPGTITFVDDDGNSTGKDVDDDKEEEASQDTADDMLHYAESSVFGSLATRIIDHVEAAVLETQSYPEPEDAHACALSTSHRLARLDGMAERLVEAAAQHRRHKSGLPDRHFSKLVKRNARNTKANDVVRERFRIAQGLGKHYNELFHPRRNRFMGGPEAAPATSGFRARMALFWLDTLARFDRTFNTRGDLPAPLIRQPLSAREMIPLCEDALLATAVLADKFDPPDERARVRKRPPPRPRAPVDFTGPPPARPKPPASAPIVLSSPSNPSSVRAWLVGHETIETTELVDGDHVDSDRVGIDYANSDGDDDEDNATDNQDDDQDH